jgi:hypothetical protein
MLKLKDSAQALFYFEERNPMRKERTGGCVERSRSRACRGKLGNADIAVEYVDALDRKQRLDRFVEVLSAAICAHLKRSSILRKEPPLRGTEN